jgi:polyphenol oxidase
MSGTAEAIRSGALAASGFAHGFFTRRGGVSGGVYASLNGGVGSRDDSAAVHENRARMAAAIGVAPDRLLVPFQVHSADALAIERPWPAEARPRCDALVTATRGLGLGVTGADCGVLLFADREAQVIGAAHAGWKGALTGIVEATVASMERLGARRGEIVAALGPTIRQPSYEVGDEFVARFVEAAEENRRFFVDSARAGRAMFDLPGFIAARAEAAGVGGFEDLRLDTYSDEERFFSYRRTTHRGEADYGRLVAAIALA